MPHDGGAMPGVVTAAELVLGGRKHVRSRDLYTIFGKCLVHESFIAVGGPDLLQKQQFWLLLFNQL